MAEEAAKSHIERFLNNDASKITDRLLEGVTNGTNFPTYLAPLISQIPDLDDDDNRMGWLPWVDSLDEVIAETPQELTEEDIDILRTKITDYIRNAETPEQYENVARLYMHSIYDDDYTMPDGASPLDGFELIALQGELGRMTAPNSSAIDKNAYPVFGMGTERFNPSLDRAQDPVNPEFIATLSKAIEQIQVDMRRAKSILPLWRIPP